MKLKDDIQRQQAIETALNRIASLGIDPTGLEGKSLTSAMKLLESIDRWRIDCTEKKRELDRCKINPTTLERYGFSRATINANPVLRAIVRHYEKRQEEEDAMVPKRVVDELQSELELLKAYKNKTIKLGIEKNELQTELENYKRLYNQALEAYASLQETGEINVDVMEQFNRILRERKRPLN